VSWSRDGKWLVFPDVESGTIHLWDVKSKKRDTIRLEGHQRGGIWGLAWSSDSRRLASASDDGTARVWDVKTRKCIFVLSGHTSNVKGIAWSADDGLLATGSLDHTIKIWNSQSGKEIATLPGHTSGVRNVQWSPDGKYLVSAGEDGRVLLSLTRMKDLLPLARKQASSGLTHAELQALFSEISSSNLIK